jgi:hypothetical protein
MDRRGPSPAELGVFAVFAVTIVAGLAVAARDVALFKRHDEFLGALVIVAIIAFPVNRAIVEPEPADRGR